ncbi:unnamed protein product [Cuscuta campestris]|uniref:BHLH domain-containing protein n=1 Tax=Cuscuta campestris TaxID=132261 RepID=A0A484LZL9_9ASTE|nr:unnamed protein product [Cuscuta campestris]
MVTGSVPQPPYSQLPAWNPNHVSALLQLGQPVNLPFFADPFPFTPVSQGVSTLLHGSSRDQEATRQYQREEAQYPIAGRKRHVTALDGSSQKKILIFDQSGDQTRLFFGPSFCQKDQKTFHDYNKNNNHLKHIVEEQQNMNVTSQSSCKESEDSEDIDALLYSDSDDEEDDDVTSTGHSPCIDDHHHKQYTEITDEGVASSDDIRSSKRQRLHDDDDENSFTDAVKLTKLPLTRGKKHDEEGLGCSNRTPDDKNNPVKSRKTAGSGEGDCTLCRCREAVSKRPSAEGNNPDESHENGEDKKVKIQKTLRILRGLIAGVNSDDPLVVIDEAISYLKLLRMKVKRRHGGESSNL